MNAAIPAPGGNVGLKTLAIYTLGGTAGVAIYFNFITQYVPDSWESASLGPINGAQAFIALSAIIGAGIASKFVK